MLSVEYILLPRPSQWGWLYRAVVYCQDILQWILWQYNERKFQHIHLYIDIRATTSSFRTIAEGSTHRPTPRRPADRSEWHSWKVLGSLCCGLLRSSKLMCLNDELNEGLTDGLAPLCLRNWWMGELPGLLASIWPSKWHIRKAPGPLCLRHWWKPHLQDLHLLTGLNVTLIWKWQKLC